MAVEYYVEFGPRRQNRVGMTKFMHETVTLAVVYYGLRVRGPHKVRHHRGEWFSAFEFSGDRMKDVQRFYAQVMELDKVPRRLISRREKVS